MGAVDGTCFVWRKITKFCFIFIPLFQDISSKRVCSLRGKTRIRPLLYDKLQIALLGMLQNCTRRFRLFIIISVLVFCAYQMHFRHVSWQLTWSFFDTFVVKKLPNFPWWVSSQYLLFLVDKKLLLVYINISLSIPEEGEDMFSKYKEF